MLQTANRAGRTTVQGKAAAGCRPLRTAIGLGLAALTLAGCAAKPQDIQSSSAAQRRPVEQAMVDMPPGGPAVLGIIERNYANATTQEITLENNAHVSGENRITVTMFGPVKQVTAPENRINNNPLATLNVGPELGWYLPGVRMQISNYYTQNRYGPFGYATGRTAGGDTCIYAWQRIQAPNANGNWFSHQGAILIRLRFCAPRTTETALLQLMTSFNINAYFLSGRWNPYGKVPPPPEGMGETGVSLLPAPSAYETTGSVAPVRRVARAPVVEPPPPVETITPDMPIVPPPTGLAPAAAVPSWVPVVVGATGSVVDPRLVGPPVGYSVVPPP